MAGEIRELILYRGVQEICAAIGINKNDFIWMVENKGLPAWKVDTANGQTGWRALHTDLLEWVKKMRDENLNTER